jgi:tripartite-type tricarboxylate transporter receptor subunit TctC
MSMRILLALLFLFAGVVHAQEYPTKTVRIVIPLTAGSGADIAGRIVAARMSEHWKQPVIIENRPGAGGQIGTAAVIKSEPDGHTLLIQSSSHAANPAIYRSLPYDPLKDTVDVAILGKTPYVMVTAASGPYKSLKGFLDAARAKPGAMPFASAGVGTSTHLAAEYVLAMAKLKMIHVPFKGSPDAIQDVLGGRSSFYMAPINAGMSLVRDGKLTALGVSTRTRAEVLPDVPTLDEQGLHGYDMTLWFGMWAPAQTPPQIVRKLNETVNAIVGEPKVKEQFAKLGIQAAPMKAEDFARFVRSEIEVYRKVVRAANIEPQ